MATRIRQLPRHRTLHLIDIENLAGAEAGQVAAASAAYRRVVRPGRHDHRVVACGTALAYAAGDAWPGALLKVGRGVDAADRLLVEWAEPDYVAAHYGRVVIGSGDHYFAPLAGALVDAGVEVSVVCRRGSLARSLEAVAPVAWFLDDVAAPAAAVA